MIRKVLEPRCDRIRCLACAAILLAASVPAHGDHVQLPDGMVVTTYVQGLTEPIAIAPAPDGRLFVAERRGAIRIIHANADGDVGTLDPTPFATLDVYINGECGLLGLALDPDFERNGYVYVFLTATATEQRVVRLTDKDNVGTDETVIRGNLPTNGGVHNGGCLRVGPDRKLYFSIGDNGDAPASDTITTLAGKIGRMNLDGSIPDDNPFVTPTGSPRAVFARGFRNPFRFCFAPDGRLFVMDVGSDGDARQEEINLVRAGRDYGWPDVEGIAASSAAGDIVNPIFTYRGQQGGAIAGCVVYAAQQFPDAFRGDLFHLDYVSGGLFRTTLDGDRVVTHTLFLHIDGAPVDLAMGTDGSLFFSRLFNGDVQRVRFKNGNGGNDPGQPAEGGSGGGTPVAEPPDVGRVCGAGAMAAMWMGLSMLLVTRASARKHAEIPSADAARDDPIQRVLVEPHPSRTPNRPRRR